MKCFALDVGYREEVGSVTAGVCFHTWEAEESLWEALVRSTTVPAPYEPGSFYKRELPCLLLLIQQVPSVDVLIIDGYVDLQDRKGLGRYLYEATGTPVVGVAKTVFHGHSGVVEVLRGESARPLFVSAAGVDLNQAASGVRAMSGPFRIPTLLKRVDALSRL